jgi:hypothetical protein
MNYQDIFDTVASIKFVSVTEEYRANMSAAQTGRKHSKESREKMSAIKKGKVFTEETRAKMSAAQKGRVFTEETKAKLRAKLKNKKPHNALQTPDGLFASALDYAEFIGCARITVYKRVEKHPDLYYWVSKGE